MNIILKGICESFNNIHATNLTQPPIEINGNLNFSQIWNGEASSDFI